MQKIAEGVGDRTLEITPNMESNFVTLTLTTDVRLDVNEASTLVEELNKFIADIACKRGE